VLAYFFFGYAAAAAVHSSLACCVVACCFASIVDRHGSKTSRNETIAFVVIITINILTSVLPPSSSWAYIDPIVGPPWMCGVLTVWGGIGGISLNRHSGRGLNPFPVVGRNRTRDASCSKGVSGLAPREWLLLFNRFAHSAGPGIVGGWQVSTSKRQGS